MWPGRRAAMPPITTYSFDGTHQIDVDQTPEQVGVDPGERCRFGAAGIRDENLDRATLRRRCVDAVAECRPSSRPQRKKSGGVVRLRCLLQRRGAAAGEPPPYAGRLKRSRPSGKAIQSPSFLSRSLGVGFLILPAR
jgi:hypothetical protein